MSKRDLYEGIVAEVEADISLIKPVPTGYMEAVEKGATSVTLPENGVSLKTPTSAFADYDVRDTVLIKAMESEEFAFVLVNKIGNTVDEKAKANNLTQDDIEALVSAGQVCVMWEQFDTATVISKLAYGLVKEHSLSLPSLNSITNKLLEARDYFPFAKARKDVMADIQDKVSAGLDNE